jgi:hypothetical protein
VAEFVSALSQPEKHTHAPGLRDAGTAQESIAEFDRQASATNNVSFLGLFRPPAKKVISFSVSFHREATQYGISLLVSIA